MHRDNFHTCLKSLRSLAKNSEYYLTWKSLNLTLLSIFSRMELDFHMSTASSMLGTTNVELLTKLQIGKY